MCRTYVVPSPSTPRSRPACGQACCTRRGRDTSEPGWARACELAFTRRLAGTDRFAAWLVEVDGRVACAGRVEEHLASPGDSDGRRGHVASMSTDSGWRRQGHGRSVLHALLTWFDGAGIARVDLRATPDGRALYERAGLRALGGPTLSRVSRP